MSRQLLYRNAQARGMFDLFLLSAITSLLAVRFYLYLTGYPQVGNGTLHIAHMLWGGLLMLAGLTVSLGFIGSRSRWLTALLGGAGFGVFIDELGKFITHDNDYFFRPTVGLIYVTFVALYLVFNFLTRAQRLTAQEYLINALSQMEEAVASDLDPAEKARVLELLHQAGRQHPLTAKLERPVSASPVIGRPRPGGLQRVAEWLDRQYARFWERRHSDRLVKLAFVAEAVILLLGSLYAAAGSASSLALLFDGRQDYSTLLLAGQTVAAVLAAGYVVYGAALLRGHRLQAFEQFRRATLVNLLLTQAFVFFRVQFAALPGFAFNLALLLLIGYVVHQERRLRAHAGQSAATA